MLRDGWGTRDFIRAIHRHLEFKVISRRLVFYQMEMSWLENKTSFFRVVKI